MMAARVVLVLVLGASGAAARRTGHDEAEASAAEVRGCSAFKCGAKIFEKLGRNIDFWGKEAEWYHELVPEGQSEHYYVLKPLCESANHGCPAKPARVEETEEGCAEVWEQELSLTQKQKWKKGEWHCTRDSSWLYNDVNCKCTFNTWKKGVWQ
uniref:Uncharacterized protein n=1 Tax=Alexandrium andersonii TaxID=327968 RepID=A0A7S2NJQ7_9DINO|mmetsp:Transcript_97896/g.219441  ORF Transcript_97896/g.219441 Transcript_97896/m.219441 type:complete len:154 (+) Transcript_97896:49-510(+)